MTGERVPGSQRKVVITGMGVLCSTANDVEEFAEALRAGRVGTSGITRLDVAAFPRRRGHQVPEFEAEAWLRHTDPDEVSPAAGYAVAAARMAVADAGLTPDRLAGAGHGVVCVGTAYGGTSEIEDILLATLPGGIEGMAAQAARRAATARLALQIARELRLGDVEASTITTACAAGNQAIGNGLDAVRSGEAQYALVGGSDALCRLCLASFTRLGLVAEEECRPFDAARDGLLVGEGAGILLLESAEAASARGARVYAEVRGYGLNCDADHPSAPEVESISRCIRAALADAAAAPEEVDLVAAHGTGTPVNDRAEAKALLEVYGPKPPRITAVKSMVGHAMGAASALGTIAGALAIDRGFIPPTANHRTTDPDCPVDCVPNRALDARVRIVQSNGLAFGGNNAVVVLGAWPRTPGGATLPELVGIER